jgi:hypothetical protein
MTILFSITWLYKWLPFVSFRLPPHNLWWALKSPQTINYTVRNIDTSLEVSAIDIKLNNKLTTIVNIYDTDSKTTQSEYQNIFTQISMSIKTLTIPVYNIN